jgi:hypothetical protein
MYHETFWVAVSAASPVIALSAVVAYTQALDRDAAQRLTIEHLVPAEMSRSYVGSVDRAGQLARRMSVSNLVVQTVTLFTSLASLAWRHDVAPPAFGLIAEVYGLVALTGAAWLSALSHAYSLRTRRDLESYGLTRASPKRRTTDTSESDDTGS